MMNRQLSIGTGALEQQVEQKTPGLTIALARRMTNSLQTTAGKLWLTLWT